MDLTQYWLALKARRKAFLMVFALTVVTAIVVALAVPKRYDAVATVLIDGVDQQTLAPEHISPRERAGYIFTQVDLVQSGKVANRVVQDLKLAQQPGVREDWEKDTGGVGSIDEWLAAKLLEKLKVDTGASNILIIKYSSNDPKKAAAVANAFAKAYLATALEIRVEPTREAATWFEGQVKALRGDVTQAQSRLAAYQKKNGVLGGDEHTDIDYTRLAEISAQLSAAKNATLDARTRYDQAKAALNDGLATGELPEVLSNPYITTVKTALQAAEGRLEEQSQVLGPKHPTYQRTALEVQTLRAQLKAETKKLIASLGNAALQSKKREQELGAALAAQQDRIMKAKDARIEMAVLTRDLDSAQRAYDGALQRYVAMKVDSRARQTNLALLTPAAEPITPAAPKVGLISILSLVIGLLLAAGVVYLLEMTDRRVRSRSDLEQTLAVPSLGILSRWAPSGGRLLPSPAFAGAMAGNGGARALPHPW
ncbi:MAG TPA: chain length determinant protein EpsF [Burkholderiales bacterium]|nr:chain length determinant protein EpsF [Burkholderiales bacterium]